jgi:hypothetical protein
MAESHIVSGLVDKRSEIAGLIEHHRKEMGHLASALGHLDATLKLFAPEINLRTLRSKQHRVRNILFRPGEMPRFILDTLRRAGGPLTSRTLAEHVVAAKGRVSTPDLLAGIQKSLLTGLKTLTNNGTLVQGPDEGPAHTWLIA